MKSFQQETALPGRGMIDASRSPVVAGYFRVAASDAVLSHDDRLNSRAPRPQNRHNMSIAEMNTAKSE